MAEFMLESIFLCFKVCLGALLITGIVILVVAPISYLTDTISDRLEEWNFRRQFDAWRLRK